MKFSARLPFAMCFASPGHSSLACASQIPAQRLIPRKDVLIDSGKRNEIRDANTMRNFGNVFNFPAIAFFLRLTLEKHNTKQASEEEGEGKETPKLCFRWKLTSVLPRQPVSQPATFRLLFLPRNRELYQHCFPELKQYTHKAVVSRAIACVRHLGVGVGRWKRKAGKKEARARGKRAKEEGNVLRRGADRDFLTVGWARGDSSSSRDHCHLEPFTGLRCGTWMSICQCCQVES
jgi:hypothetical protein